MAHPADTQKKCDLILLTNHFPFGKGEAFLETEIPYLVGAFASVTILTKNTKDASRGNYPGVRVLRVASKSTLRTSVRTVISVVARLTVVSRLFFEEIRDVRKFNVAILTRMLHDLFKAVEKSVAIEDAISGTPSPNAIVLYAYWLDSSALAATLVRTKSRKTIRVSRAHGGDVHEFRHALGYLSYRRALVERLDRIFTISEDARRVLEKRVDNHAGKIEVSRLGTKPQQFRDIPLASPLVLVSCSFIVPVKRIHLIIEALAMVNVSVHWIHIGDGPLYDEIALLASEKLSGNQKISYSLKGFVGNEDLQVFYRETPVHAFINTSETEGIPVTFMEAQSFGIPVIAPEIGGIPELLSAESGVLFSAKATSAEIAQSIEHLASQSPDSYSAMRHNSYRNWNQRYNAERNFPTFTAKLLSLCQL